MQRGKKAKNGQEKEDCICFFLLIYIYIYIKKIQKSLKLLKIWVCRGGAQADEADPEDHE